MSEYYIDLGLVVRWLISQRATVRDRGSESTAVPILWAAFLTFAIAGPWLQGGYLFGTDWPGPRRFNFPSDVSNLTVPQVALAVVSLVVSGEATGKLFVLGILFVAAISAYRAVPVGGFVPRAAASSVYVLNPFVYGRLHYGQLFLVAGYAVLPWAVLRLRMLLFDPGVRKAMAVAVSLALLGVLSLHVFLMAGLLAGLLTLTHTVGASDKALYIKRLAPDLAVAFGTTLVLSAYWIVPALISRGPAGTVIAGIGAGDLAAYAAVSDPRVGLLTNLVGLYGFWAENSGRFTSMKDFVPLWPAILVGLLLVGAIGMMAAFRQRPRVLVPWVTALFLSAVIGVVLEMGVSHPWTTGLVTWLDAHFVLYRGMRDAGKWAALLAFVYSQLVALGVAVLLNWLDVLAMNSSKRDWIVGATTGLLLAMPLYYGNGLLFGAHGEIRPSQYPDGWYAADRMLASDQHPDRALFLPWHQYMSYSFIRNQNNVVIAPAPTFFSVPVLVSSNPEVPGVVQPISPDQDAISGIVEAGSAGQWAAVLAAQHIKYVLVAHELNWSSFKYLDTQAGLMKIGDYGSIVVYRNLLVG